MADRVPKPLSGANRSAPIDRLAEIRATLAAAFGAADLPWPTADYWDAERPEDADLIANAPTDLLWLLAEVDAMRAVIAGLRGEVRGLEGVIGIASPWGNSDSAINRKTYQVPE